ncbi:hypothetical protein TI05_10810 [Achromatium sp. WMS3]|nr:hypothetical protein TI05_10810 [Achromatium sp. WMS3]
MHTTTLINGQYQDTILIGDRGLQYADGLFETISVVAGFPCLWERHLARLQLGCNTLKIAPIDFQQLTLDAHKIVANCTKGTLKIIITRGIGERGYKLPSKAKPTSILMLHPPINAPESWWQNGVQAQLCQTPISSNPALAGIKHLNRLEQILARMEWTDPNIAEGLMCNTQGHWISGTKTNLFLVLDNNQLLTPDLTASGIAGVMRSLVLDYAKSQGMKIQQGIVTTKALEQAQSIFLTNALIGMWPVRTLAGINYNIDSIPKALRTICSQATTNQLSI